MNRDVRLSTDCQEHATCGRYCVVGKKPCKFHRRVRAHFRPQAKEQKAPRQVQRGTHDPARVRRRDVCAATKHLSCVIAIARGHLMPSKLRPHWHCHFIHALRALRVLSKSAACCEQRPPWRPAACISWRRHWLRAGVWAAASARLHVDLLAKRRTRGPARATKREAI